MKSRPTTGSGFSFRRWKKSVPPQCSPRWTLHAASNCCKLCVETPIRHFSHDYFARRRNTQIVLAQMHSVAPARRAISARSFTKKVPPCCRTAIAQRLRSLQQLARRRCLIAVLKQPGSRIEHFFVNSIGSEGSNAASSITYSGGSARRFAIYFLDFEIGRRRFRQTAVR